MFEILTEIYLENQKKFITARVKVSYRSPSDTTA